VIKGQDNRVPQPKGPDYIVFWPLRQERIETNTDKYLDLKFIGSVKDKVLTIEKVEIGGISLCEIQAIERKLKWLIERAHEVLKRIQAGHLGPDDEEYIKAIDKVPKELGERKVFGVGLEPGTQIVRRLEKDEKPVKGKGKKKKDDDDELDSYLINKSHNIKSQVLSAGVAQVLQPMKVTYQLDIYGPESEENVAKISTLFRDPYGVANYQGWPKQDSLVPLYHSDPHMLAFVNEEKQYERRWIIELVMQANMYVRNVPQQFADHLQLLTIDVDNDYRQQVIAVPPPAKPWKTRPGAEVMKLQRILDGLHRQIKYIHKGMLGVL
jgi:hypothetical protein